MIGDIYLKRVKKMNKEIKWKPFELGKVFNITATKSGIDKNKILEINGNIPYITRTELNNGIGAYIGKTQLPKYEQNKGNVITIGLDTQTVHYQPISFYTGQNIQILEHEHLNEDISKFLIPLIRILMKKFNWGGSGATLTRLKRSKILLPITEDGTIHWEFMYQYIQTIERKSINEVFLFLNNESKKVSEHMSVSLSDVKWSVFTLEDIVEISSGVRLTKSNMKVGYRPFIGATEFNNGITNYVLNTNSSIDHNVLGINYNGSVCQGFYHPYEAIFSDDVKRLRFKNGINNEYTLQFLLTVIEKQRSKYQYGYKFNEKRMKKQKVVLPTTNENEVDFKFMENYIKKLKYNAIIKTLNSLKKN